ncbi:MAG: signal peptidase I [Flavobacteriales bacterium]
MIDTVLLVLTVILHFATLWRIFQKAGRKAWEGLVPVYNLFIWLKLMQKPAWWVLLFLIPGVNFLMTIILHVETVKMFDRRGFLNTLIAIFLPWVYIPYLAFDEKEKWHGPVRWLRKQKGDKKEKGKLLMKWRTFRDRVLEKLGMDPAYIQQFDEIPMAGERNRTAGKEWGDAIVFAVIAATIIRGFLIEAFTIPTSSMERSLLVGDYLFVSKVNYGSRVPQTPVAFPFAQHTLPLTKNTPSYLEWYTLPYLRLPGLDTVQRNDVVVFNFPAGDTVASKQQSTSYYQLVRRFGRRAVHNNERRFGEILSRPVDKRDNYIKRCVGIPGDTIRIEEDRLHINGEPAERPENAQWKFKVDVKKRIKKEYLMERFGISRNAIRYDAGMKQYTIAMTLDAKKALANSELVRNIKKKGETPVARRFIKVFPHDPDRPWSMQNFGPLWIPEKGATVQLTLDNLPFYERIIDKYEGHDLNVKNGTIYIDGQQADSYTFEMDYYWMMGDNRHSSLDSRAWGFVPENHVVGEALFVWFSVASPAPGESSWFFQRIRWGRIFSGIH